MKIPQGSDIGWLIAAGVDKEEIERVLEKEKKEKEITDHYERVMGYNPLNWSGKDLMRLKRFLVTKSKEEITAFAKWSKDRYNSFSPAKARLYPGLVIDLWKQAVPEKEDKYVGGQYADFIEH